MPYADHSFKEIFFLFLMFAGIVYISTYLGGDFLGGGGINIT